MAIFGRSGTPTTRTVHKIIPSFQLVVFVCNGRNTVFSDDPSSDLSGAGGCSKLSQLNGRGALPTNATCRLLLLSIGVLVGLAAVTVQGVTVLEDLLAEVTLDRRLDAVHGFKVAAVDPPNHIGVADGALDPLLGRR